ncbi:serine-rich coiled-coil domain-containing protein 2-like isoform X2 [Synchiropus splendidus]|uniref:serine-rich coiled-coil domain-containing protein 2-like isoform X2 n=1 Tax=Synchiropus splendidus TaxID=270530 RepID=UPI00237EBBFB|nr:serine-rich coiled-coil domain-containing protein 2-like isoform X2 [Synchiropus splendidus]
MSTLVFPAAMPTMVSRLPKFGFRPKQPSSSICNGPIATSSPPKNGFYHHPGPAEGDGDNTTHTVSIKQNGFLRVPTSLSLKWKKERPNDEVTGHVVARHNQNRNNAQQEVRPPQKSLLVPQRRVEKPRGKSVAPTQPGRPSARSPLPGTRTHPGFTNKSNGLKSSSTQINESKQNSSGSYGIKAQGGSLLRPLQTKTPASRSQSSDNLRHALPPHLTESDRHRSLSLTQVRPQPSPPSSTVPIGQKGFQGPAAQHHYTTQKGREVKVPAKSGLRPPNTLKKALLPTLVSAPKTNGISYKLSRPSLNKPRPLRATSHGDQEVNKSQTLSTEASTETGAVSLDDTESSGTSTVPESHLDVSVVGDCRDMSLSSTSSLEQPETSPDLQDDLDQLGNDVALFLSTKNEEEDSGLDRSSTRFDDDKLSVNGVTMATGLSFLDDGLDWTDTSGTGETGVNPLSSLRRSSQDEQDQAGSSLDLSPSDSCGSGGTYMWDEEGLEPLGGATNATSHHIGSFDSDINSIEMMTGLDSADLEEDDLMLDTDLLEEDSLTTDGDGMTHMAEWRRRQLCWTQDVTNDNQCEKKDPVLEEDLILNLQPPRYTNLSTGSGLGLDVEELVEDCSSICCQLEYLKELLLQEKNAEEKVLTPDALIPGPTETTQAQVESLQQEVLQLKEELRSRDRTISQLMMKLSVPTATTRCRCQESRSDQQTQTTEKTESVGLQTSWKEQTSQVLKSSDTDSVKVQAPTGQNSNQKRSLLQPSKNHLFLSKRSISSDSPSKAKLTHHKSAPPGLGNCSLFRPSR